MLGRSVVYLVVKAEKEGDVGGWRSAEAAARVGGGAAAAAAAGPAASLLVSACDFGSRPIAPGFRGYDRRALALKKVE